MSNTPLHRISDAPRRPASGARAVSATAALMAALLAAGCAGTPTAPEDAPVTASRQVLSKISFATQATAPLDFVKAARRPPESLAYIPISTPQDEPTLKPADKTQVERRAKAAKDIKPRRDAIAAARPSMSPPPQLPASALQAKQEHDERMRERASPAE